jgi:hypothetical protein
VRASEEELSMKQGKVLRLAAAVLLVAETVWAGPVVIDGTDANDHGSAASGTNLDGWFYMQKVLENLAAQIGPNIAKVVVDVGTTEPSQARDAIDSAFALSTLPGNGWTLEHVDGAGDIDNRLGSISPSNAGILYIPTAGNTAGDVDDDELTVINARGFEIGLFVSTGGGLFAMGESPFGAAAPFGWLAALLPGAVVTDVGAGGVATPLTLTAEGQCAFRGLSSADLSTGPWHNFFAGDFGALEVLATAADDSGTTRAIVIGGAGVTFGALHGSCIARNARYWFTHIQNDDPTCATLKRAIQANGGGLSIGYLCLPTLPRRGNIVDPATLSTIESLGFLWKDRQRTGEDGGTQSQGLRASQLCRARKRLSVEVIAAIANNVLLGTAPSNCMFTNGGAPESFPADLIRQARSTVAGEDIVEIQKQTLLLRKFNKRRLLTIDDLAIVGLKECRARENESALRTMARDATTQLTCPGVNNACETAEAVIFPATTDPFAQALFSRKVRLLPYTDNFTSPACGTGGRDAIWKITPNVGAAGRQFTVDTKGSNLNTLLSVWRGPCDSLAQVACNDDVAPFATSRLTFTTDGTNTFFLVGEGLNDQVGELRIRVTSP